MGLIQNGYRDQHGSLKFAGAGFSNGAYPAVHHNNFFQNGRRRNLNGEGITDEKISVPVGYRHPYSIIMAQKAGGMGSTGSLIAGSCTVATPGNLAAGMNIESSIAGSGGINSAEVALIMFAQAALSGVSSMSAPATAALNMAITIAGSGSISDAAINYAESKNMVALLSGSSVMSAPLGALTGATATLQGTASMSANIRAEAWGSCDIAPATTTAATVIASAVWDYLSAQADAPGSMGEAVLAAGGGLVPPSVNEIAAAVLAVLEANNIPVNTVQIKGQDIAGSGTESDPWGPA